MADTGSNGFRSIPNPYIVGNPIEDRRMFFGREDDFTYIRQKVTGGKQGGLIVLCGTRRSGKTSILFQIKRGRLGEDFVPVLIDMQSMTVDDDREFIARLAREVVDAVDDPALSFTEAFPLSPGANPYQLFHDLMQRVNTTLGRRQLVLLFDEYELFESHIDKGRISTDILNLLANWMETRRGVFIIFTGSDRIEERNPQYWQAFMGKALHRRISFLSRDDTLRLIEDPVRDLVRYGTDVPERIHALTAGQPFYTQVICQSLLDHLNEEHKRDVTTEDLRLAVDEIIENPLPQMIFTWTSLDNLEKMTLSVIAELGRDGPVYVRSQDIASYLGQARTGVRMKPGKLKEALERLFHQDLLDKGPEGETYAFKMDLWRLWMGRMHSIWQVVDEIGGGGQALGPGLRRDPMDGRRPLRLAAIATLTLAVLAAIAIWLPGPWRGDGAAEIAPTHVAVPDSAYLTVTTEPAGAAVFLDDRLLGRSPVGPRRVAVHTGVLRLELPGYRNARLPQTLVKNDTSRVHTVLQELTGDLHLTSRPSGADVTFDDAPTGLRTPCTLADLPTRLRHHVRFELANHVARTYHDLEILPDTTLVLYHDFTMVTHDLTVITNPADAELHLAGRHLGNTPYRLTNMAHGRLVVELRKDGYEIVRRTVDVPAPDDMVTFDLRPLPPGRLVIGIIPFADIYIDDVLKSNATQRDSFDLEAGRHLCRLVHPQLGADSLWVEIDSGGRHEVLHDFTR